MLTSYGGFGDTVSKQKMIKARDSRTTSCPFPFGGEAIPEPPRMRVDNGALAMGAPNKAPSCLAAVLDASRTWEHWKIAVIWGVF